MTKFEKSLPASLREDGRQNLPVSISTLLKHENGDPVGNVDQKQMFTENTFTETTRENASVKKKGDRFSFKVGKWKLVLQWSVHEAEVFYVENVFHPERNMFI